MNRVGSRGDYGYSAVGRFVAMTAAAARKAFSSVVHFWQRAVGPENPDKPVEDRVGKYYADYTAPTGSQICASEPELDELFQNSKVVSAKREV